MSNIVARTGRVVSPNLPALPASESKRFTGILHALCARVMATGSERCPYGEQDVIAGPQPELTFLDVLARDKPDLYTLSPHV